MSLAVVPLQELLGEYSSVFGSWIVIFFECDFQLGLAYVYCVIDNVLWSLKVPVSDSKAWVRLRY